MFFDCSAALGALSGRRLLAGAAPTTTDATGKQLTPEHFVSLSQSMHDPWPPSLTALHCSGGVSGMYAI